MDRAESRGLTREVFALALPVLGSGLVDMGQHWTNQVWIAGLGTAATTALSVATFGLWAFGALAALVAVGLGALVGRYAGASREGAARWVALQGIRWAWPLAVVVGIAGAFAAPLFVSLAGTTDEAAREAVVYLRIFYGGGAATLTLLACEAVWRGRGLTRVPLVVSACVLVLNAALDPLLIYGAAFVPGLGVAGAAISSVVAKALGAWLSFRWLKRRGFVSKERPADDELRLHETTPLSPGPFPGLDLSVARRLVRVGVPSALQGLFFVWVYVLLSQVVTSAGGDAAQSGLGSGLRGEQVAFFVGGAFAAAAASLVARRLGAARPDDAARAAWRAVLLASAGCLAWSLLLWACADPLAWLFLRKDPAAAAHAAAYFKIVALCLVPQCWEVVLEGAFGGAGFTIPPMVVSMAITAARVPLARWAAFDLHGGVEAIWWVIAATAALRGVLMAAWFARGTWKTRTV